MVNRIDTIIGGKAEISIQMKKDLGTLDFSMSSTMKAKTRRPIRIAAMIIDIMRPT